MYNIQKAVSRLDYAPKVKEIQITDIKKGIGLFTPIADKSVSFAVLKSALKKAGYTLDSAEITVSGILKRDGKESWLVALPSGQRFALEGADVKLDVDEVAAETRVEITGDWKTVGQGATAREVIQPRDVKKTEAVPAPRAGSVPSASSAPAGEFMTASFNGPTPAARFIPASFKSTPPISFTDLIREVKTPALPRAPIRVTSPGLTVYKGGAVTPRLFFIKQHLGDLEVTRQVLQLSVSYTPTPRAQFEVELPFSRTSFADGVGSGSGVGFGNITLWSKYRFYRTVKTYGDRQAAVRFGLELPTGNKTAPGEAQVDAPEFVRQQLTPINGGLSPHFDITFSQAGGRLIFGGNIEGILRTERGGYPISASARICRRIVRSR